VKIIRLLAGIPFVLFGILALVLLIPYTHLIETRFPCRRFSALIDYFVDGIESIIDMLDWPK